jgi:hypothetical protein
LNGAYKTRVELSAAQGWSISGFGQHELRAELVDLDRGQGPVPALGLLQPRAHDADVLEHEAATAARDCAARRGFHPETRVTKLLATWCNYTILTRSKTVVWR